MDKIERVRRLRDEYEAALDEAEAKRAEYHREVVKLHRSGMPLREIADALGISHQRVHQIVGGEPEKRRKRIKRARGVAAALCLAVVSAVGTLVLERLESGPQTAQRVAPSPVPLPRNAVVVPDVVGLSYETAVSRLSAVDLCSAATASTLLGHSDVLAQRPAPGEPATGRSWVSLTLSGGDGGTPRSAFGGLAMDPRPSAVVVMDPGTGTVESVVAADHVAGPLMFTSPGGTRLRDEVIVADGSVLTRGCRGPAPTTFPS